MITVSRAPPSQLLLRLVNEIRRTRDRWLKVFHTAPVRERTISGAMEAVREWPKLLRIRQTLAAGGDHTAVKINKIGMQLFIRCKME